MLENTPAVDSVRESFMHEYENALADLEEEFGVGEDEDEKTDLRISAMIEANLSIRTKFDPELENELMDEKADDDMRYYLMAELAVLGMADAEDTSHIFAEYMLYCLLEEDEVEERVDVKFLKNVFENLVPKLPKETFEDIMKCKHVFKWGNLYTGN